jgi:hypothetical protein
MVAVKATVSSCVNSAQAPDPWIFYCVLNFVIGSGGAAVGRKGCLTARTRYYVLPLVILVVLTTQTGCPPSPQARRTKTIELPQPIEIEPVIVEHLGEHVTYDSRSREYQYRFEPTQYTLKAADGREMDVFISDNPYVVIRSPATGGRNTLGWWAAWGEPEVRYYPYERPPATPTTQGVTP